ncbi:CSEP0483 putative effector protein [Blumeria hordei DH14]|uniref:CSEP0483 putative effector protein n=1 Tax=Blumeria graminis f. sp. hordei (strain DH14) TaxID=546991 RepID=N1JJ65_BLUG1|nr:CSEP0483 putative effector protein [Blumeria hordei DH14]
MKFPSAASTAAFAGLLLLVPTAYGAEYFDCGNGVIFPYSQVLQFAGGATRGRRASGDPEPPNGDRHKTRKFSRVPSSGDSSINLFELRSGQWSECGYIDNFQHDPAWRTDLYTT